jgi:hypothetical protein
MKYHPYDNKMLILAHRVLHYLGATEVSDVTTKNDPSNEEEFLKLSFTSPRSITWDMYLKAYGDVEKMIGSKLLRIERNNQLSKTDWVMTADIYQSLKNKEEWVAYRQDLRDLTKNPPQFKWKENGTLDIDNMSLPIQPKVIR